jgi:hypothetical protein
MMTTLHKPYDNESAARRAVGELRAAGVSGPHIRFVITRPPRDVRRETVGGFAGPVGPEGPVGTFANRVLVRRQAAGGFAGDPDDQRQGSFADVERVVIVTHTDEQEHSRVTGYRATRQLLRQAALEDDAIDRAVKELHIGRTVVLVDAAQIPATAVRAHLEQVAKAA